MTATLVDEYGTRLRATEIHRLPTGTFRWTHRPGADRSPSLIAPAPPLATRLAAASVPGARWVPATTAADGAVAYDVHSPLSAAAWLANDQPQTQLLLLGALEAAGRALRELHRLEAATPATAPGLARTAAWLENTGDSELSTLAAQRWGSDRLARLCDWCVEQAEGTVVLHGFASLATVLPPLSIPETEILVGADLAAGRGETDLGWILGELTEFAAAGEHSAVDFAALADALRQGYGPDYDVTLLGRAAVLRLVTHMHDYAAYVGWHNDFTRYADLAAELIDDEGRRAVTGGVA